MKNKRLVRVIIDSQSNQYFWGIESEQNYDQRAGLAQVGEGDVVITTNQIETGYINYWKGLGFSIPKLMIAGPFNENLTLSDLIANNPKIIKDLKSFIGENASRLEFFTITEHEENVSNVLGIEPYVNFDFAHEYQRKDSFKKLFKDVGISTLPYVDISEKKISFREVKEILGESQLGYMAKNFYGTGGVNLKGIIHFRTEKQYNKINGNYIVEPKIKVAVEFSAHWEIKNDKTVKLINIFEQLADNMSYAGTAFPVNMDAQLLETLTTEHSMLVSEIIKRGGLGFMCCDIIIDENGKAYWSDLNPRKGAIIFINDSVHRLMKIHSIKKPFYVYHKHIGKAKNTCFSDVKKILGNAMKFSLDGFILVTNPGIFRHGSVDLTAISFTSREHAKEMLQINEEKIAL